MNRRSALGLLFGSAAAWSLLPRPTWAQRRTGPAVIVLDAGHGGKDPGAIGVSGTEEKDVTLAVCQAIRAAYGNRRDVKILLTRADDRFLPLGRRVAIAHQHDADLFVSIHADAAPTRAARGMSAYTLSEKASDGFASALAQRENMVDKLYGVDLSDTDKTTAAILFDLASRYSKGASLDAKRRIISGVQGKIGLLENPMRSANFAVLRSRTMPSILIETGFLSNPTDEKLLANAASRAQLARTLGQHLVEVATDLKVA